MTLQDIRQIAEKLDKATKKKIDKEVNVRLKILEDDLSESELDEMEECLYTAFVLQEYLDSEYELLEEERLLILEEMEYLYNEYGDLLAHAKIEEKLSKKKRMTLELMRIREQLLEYKERFKDVNERMEDTQKKSKELDKLTSKEKMKEIAKEEKELKEKKASKFNLGLGSDTKTNENKEMANKDKKIRALEGRVERAERELTEREIRKRNNIEVSLGDNSLINAYKEQYKEQYNGEHGGQRREPSRNQGRQPPRKPQGEPSDRENNTLNQFSYANLYRYNQALRDFVNNIPMNGRDKMPNMDYDVKNNKYTENEIKEMIQQTKVNNK